jgi:hypothetical protein
MYLEKYIFTALETGRKAISLWQALLVCFAASANKNYFYQQQIQEYFIGKISADAFTV